MSTARILAGAGLAVLLLASPAAAQGLGDKAANERSKREKKAGKQEPPKVFTNEDLDKGRPPGTRTESSSPSETSSPSGSSSPDPEPTVDRNAQEKDYLDAITSAQQAVTAAQTRVQALAEKLNPMSVSYIYGAGGSNDANEELRVRAELREAEAQLQVARQNVATANDNLRGSRQGRSPQPLVER